MESLVVASNLTSTILLEHSTVTFSDVLTTTPVGPRAMRQIMNFNNQTVADKVPTDMLHLIDPHWLFSIFPH